MAPMLAFESTRQQANLDHTLNNEQKKISALIAQQEHRSHFVNPSTSSLPDLKPTIKTLHVSRD
ncbi:hypothetical protein KIN20_037387 [Parelaphostrongylus tenuis]|uniref:Uncharacterized protein n=1 Tax=Parelaphostrongylus tenuis TaxID=148309 RepID=A0AAD5REJ0_PARTN|nr:hypothetical protein KIN20_037387 [Parelaphostrongylus tenuis]